MSSLIPIEKIQERIRFENDWWQHSVIPTDYDDMSRREYFQLFYELVRERTINRAVILMWPRRVGKTVMLYHTVAGLIQDGVDPQKILLITVENPIYNWLSLEELFEQGRLANDKEDTHSWYVIFDEIQYLKDWEVQLKTLVDDHRTCKFIASWSAAATLKMKSTESGAGRFTDFTLPPLTFHEYIHMQWLQNLIIAKERPEGYITYTTKYINDLNSHFMDYINYGWYPEMVFSPIIRKNPQRFIKQDIVDKVLLRDLPSLYGISDVQELNSFFTTLCYQSWNECSLEQLSKQSWVNKVTIKKYIGYLESAFLIHQVKKINQNGKIFQRDTFFKIYLTNPSLRSALFTPIQPSDSHIWAMVETAVFAQWLHRDWMQPYYARWTENRGGEVDLVFLNAYLKPATAVEVKWSDRFFERPEELVSLYKFVTENSLSTALVTTMTAEWIRMYNGIQIEYMPTALYAYTVGRRTMELRQK
jgi:uncharacterized protein